MSSRRSNVYLVGPMGSGKTTIGQRLARLLEMNFFDSDRELESQTGASVNLIFDVEGEAGFRERETQMLEILCAKDNVLLATGGGAVLKTGNRELLKRTGVVVYLQISVGQQLNRLHRDRSRPLLQDGDRKQKLTAMATLRNPLYEETADIVFPCTNRGPNIAARILASTLINHLELENARTEQETE